MKMPITLLVQRSYTLDIRVTCPVQKLESVASGPEVTDNLTSVGQESPYSSTLQAVLPLQNTVSFHPVPLCV